MSRATLSVVTAEVEDSSYVLGGVKLRKNTLFSSKFVLPGGKLLGRESASECALRETQEETGLRLQASSLAFIGSLFVDKFANKDETAFVNEETEIYLFRSHVSTQELPDLSVSSEDPELAPFWIPETTLQYLNTPEAYSMWLHYALLGCNSIMGHIFTEDDGSMRDESIAYIQFPGQRTMVHPATGMCPADSPPLKPTLV